MATPRVVTAPRVRPVMQVAVGNTDVEVGQAVYDTARYNEAPDATYAGTMPLWSDASCDVVEAVTYYGRQRSIDVFDVGTATLRVQNPDGYWDYPPTSDATVISLRPGRQIRVGVRVDASTTTSWLWHGWIDATQPAYDPAEGVDVVTVNCVDAKGEVGRTDVARLDTAVGAGETVTDRMNRYANVVAFPTGRRQFDASGVTLAATQMGGRLGAMMDRSARSAGGDVFGDQGGNLVYRSIDWQTRGTGVAPDGVIGNRGVDGEVCPNVWDVLFQRSDFAQRVVYGTSGGTQAERDDPANMAGFGYGVETFTMTDLETQDAQIVSNLANRVLRNRSFNTAPRIASCTLDAARPGVIELLTAADPYGPSLYSCGHVAPDGRTVFARTMYLTGIEHTITGGKWTARLQLDDASPWVTYDSRYDAAHYNTDRYARAG